MKLHRISPLLNPAAQTIVDLTKRTIHVNFAGNEEALKTPHSAKAVSRARNSTYPSWNRKTH
ncbi:MAG: hypothetical protein WCF90_05700 [Methanomicrobiales archaeon]